jgi:rhamnogalacturonyl hydrolase YesR
MKVQGPNGGLRVWLDDQTSPEEVTGTAMCISSIHEAMQKGWLNKNYEDFVARGWQYILGSITEEGRVINAYTGWAVPAEKKILRMDEKFRGYVPGIVLVAAAEMLE